MDAAEIRAVVGKAQAELRSRVLFLLRTQGRFGVPQYARFLTMQYFLTENVQMEFYAAAGNHAFRNRPDLRDFLINFAREEEMHYRMAREDLLILGEDVGEKPIDVDLWKKYFERTTVDRPCLRIGATCVLENIANKSTQEILQLVENEPRLNLNNTRFLRLHMHDENLPHGQQILDVVDNNSFSEAEKADLLLGARIARKIYLQLVDWIITGAEVLSEGLLARG